MSAFQWALAGLLSGAVVWLYWFIRYWLPRQPGDQYEDGAQSQQDAEQILEASRPAPLEDRPHVSARNYWSAQ